MRNRSFLEGILSYIAYQAWAVGLGAFWFYFQIANTASSVPDPIEGRTAGMNNHGEWFFVYPWQKTLFWGALFGSLLIFFLAVVAMQIFLGKDAVKKVHPLTLGLAVLLGAIGWVLVVQLV